MFLVPNIDQMYKEIVEVGIKKRSPDLPTLILKTMQLETHIYFFGLITKYLYRI
jgi:hypothetical protein